MRQVHAILFFIVSLFFSYPAVSQNNQVEKYILDGLSIDLDNDLSRINSISTLHRPDKTFYRAADNNGRKTVFPSFSPTTVNLTVPGLGILPAKPGNPANSNISAAGSGLSHMFYGRINNSSLSTIDATDVAESLFSQNKNLFRQEKKGGLIVHPDTVDFGLVGIGESKAYLASVFNPIGADAFITLKSENPVFSSREKYLFLENGKTQQVNLLFKPQGAGLFEGLIYLITTDTTLKVCVRGESRSFPKIMAAANTLTFDLSVADSQTQVINLMNSGRTNLNWKVQGPLKTAMDSVSDYQQSNNLPLLKKEPDELTEKRQGFFRDGPDWLIISPQSGVISPGEQQEITVQAKSNGFFPSSYRSYVNFYSVDADSSSCSVPVLMTVEAHYYTFSVDMSIYKTAGYFNPLSGDALYLSGSFNNWSVESIYLMENTEDDVYKLDVPLYGTPGDTLEYVFFILTGDQREIPANGWEDNRDGFNAHRSLVLDEGDHILPTDFFNNNAQGWPHIINAPDSINVTLYDGDSVKAELNLGNRGSADLFWKARIINRTASHRGLKKQSYLRDLTEDPLNAHESEYSSPASDILIHNRAPRSEATSFHDGFEQGNYNMWTATGGVYTREVVSETSTGGRRSFKQEGAGNHFQGISASFGPSRPEQISFSVRPTSNNPHAYFVLGDNNIPDNGGMIFFYAYSGYLRIVSDDSELQIPHHRHSWYHIELKNIDYTARTYDLYINSELLAEKFPFRSQQTTELTTLYLYNYDAFSTAYYDDISIGEETLAATNSVLKPASGIIAPLEEQKVSITIHADELTFGSFKKSIRIDSNDPLNPQIEIPLNLTVEWRDPPVLSLRPDSFFIELIEGDSSSALLNIDNSAGSGNLIWNLDVKQLVEENNIFEAADYPEYFHETVQKNVPDTRIGYPVTEGFGGPDLFGYKWMDSDEPGGPDFNWIEINSIGSALVLQDDGNSGLIDLGFNFSFYGALYNQITIASNGWLSFTNTSGSVWSNPLPSLSAPENVIALCAMDLYPGPGQCYYYRDIKNNRFIVEYENWSVCCDDEIYLSMQAIISADGSIKIQYNNVRNDISYGTIGLQNATKSDGLIVAYNTPYIKENLAVQITNNISWLSAESVGGIIAAGDAYEAQLKVRPLSMGTGNYFARLTVQTNDPDKLFATLPVHLRVFSEDSPAFNLKEDTLKVALSNSDTISLAIPIFNSGSGDLNWQVSFTNGEAPHDNLWLTAHASSGTIGPASEGHVKIIFDACNQPLGRHSAYILFESNDPAHEQLSLPVVMDVLPALPAHIHFTPDRIFNTLAPNDTATNILTINNSGPGTLHWSLTETADSISSSYSRLYERYMNEDPVVTDEVSNLNPGPPQLSYIPYIVIEAHKGHSKILAYLEYTDKTQEYLNTLNAIARYYDDFQLTTINTLAPALLVPALEGIDVLLIPEQETGGTADIFYSMGEAGQEVLQGFVSSGGVIVLCGSVNGSERILAGSQLLDISVADDLSSDSMHVNEPAHFLTENLSSSSFAADNATIAYNLNDPDALSLIENNGAVSVLYKSYGSGYMAVIGNDFYNYSDDAARIISNAVSNRRNRFKLSEKSGRLAAGQTHQIRVTSSADRKEPGSYASFLRLESNDSTQAVNLIPVKLNIMPSDWPRIVVRDTVQFNVASGQESNSHFIIFNRSTEEALNYTIEIKGDTLSADSTAIENWLSLQPDSSSIAAQDSQIVFVSVNGPNLVNGIYEGDLVITSNDIEYPLKYVRVIVNIEEFRPPHMSISLDSLHVITEIEEENIKNLVISNNGSGPLNLKISLNALEMDSVLSVTESVLSINSRDINDNVLSESAANTEAAPTAFTLFNPLSSNGLNIGVISAAPLNQRRDVINKLNATNTFNTITSINGQIYTPTILELSTYDAVFVWNSTYYHDAEALGNILADFVDAGGTVIDAFDDFALLEGRWYAEKYNVIAPVKSTNGFMGLSENSLHYVVKNVTAFEGGEYSYRPGSDSLSTGAEILVSWRDGMPLVASKLINGTRRVDLGMFPPSSDVAPAYWNTAGEGALLMVNAIMFAISGKWVTLSQPGEKTVLPDSTFNLQVNFSSYSLRGGSYKGYISISHNDPDTTGLILVPLKLTYNPLTALSENVAELPSKFELKNNYPNPFNPETTIEYSIPSTARVTLKVYDMLGREVRILVQEKQNAGYYKVVFKANDLASGIYFYYFKSDVYEKVKKMILVR